MVKHTLPSSDSTIPKNRAVIWIAVSSQRQAHEDKVSLEEQESLARKWCADNGYQVVRVLTVPGYSRRESDIFHAMEEFASQGIHAYHDLRRMWQEDEFDVLVAYSHDRLGRSSTLHSFVVENVIQSDKQIYLLNDGWVGKDSFRMQIALGGYTATAEIDKLIQRAKAAKNKLIQQGLPIGSQIIMSHKLIRDPETGNALRLELDEQYESIWEDLAELFLEGVGYNRLGEELIERYGHIRPDGDSHDRTKFYDLFFAPTFWGHLAQNYTASSSNGDSRGAWVFDESVEPPEGVTIAYNVVPAVYTGDLADKVKAELHRRIGMQGKRRPHNTYRFSGLFVCGECGTNMSVRSKSVNKRTGLKCSSLYSRTTAVDDCSQRYLTPHRYLQAKMEELLEQLVAGASPEIFEQTEQPNEEESRLERLRDEQQSIEQKINVLINELSSAPEAARDLYRKQIQQHSDRLEKVTGQLRDTERKVQEDSYRNYEETRTLEELKQLTLECFWNLPDREINQWLSRLMGNRKFVVMDREIIGVVDLSD